MSSISIIVFGFKMDHFTWPCDSLYFTQEIQSNEAEEWCDPHTKRKWQLLRSRAMGSSLIGFENEKLGTEERKEGKHYRRRMEVGSRGPALAPPLLLHWFNYNCHLVPFLSGNGTTERGGGVGVKAIKNTLWHDHPPDHPAQRCRLIWITAQLTHTITYQLIPQWQSAKIETCGFISVASQQLEFTGEGGFHLSPIQCHCAATMQLSLPMRLHVLWYFTRINKPGRTFGLALSRLMDHWRYMQTMQCYLRLLRCCVG